MNSKELQDIRKAKKLTQDQFAEWLGIKKRRLQSWEAGLYPIPDWAVEKLQSAPTLNPKLTLEQFQKLGKKAEEQGKTIEQVIADIINAALALVLFLGGAYALLS